MYLQFQNHCYYIMNYDGQRSPKIDINMTEKDILYCLFKGFYRNDKQNKTILYSTTPTTTLHLYYTVMAYIYTRDEINHCLTEITPFLKIIISNICAQCY